MSWLTNLEAVVAAGGSAISSTGTSLVGTVAGMLNTMSAQAGTALTTVVSNYSNPDIVKEETNKILEIANLPAGAAVMAQAIPAAAAAAVANPAVGMPNLLALVSGIKSLL